VKYVRTPGFLIDLRRLPEEHRKLFAAAVHEQLRPSQPRDLRRLKRPGADPSGGLSMAAHT
jgi:hypothetical protein